MKILVLTMHEDEEWIFQILKAGASGYLIKDSAMTVSPLPFGRSIRGILISVPLFRKWSSKNTFGKQNHARKKG